MKGKYSPTVSSAYSYNQRWHELYSDGEVYDPEGYDSYGYNSDGLDRVDNQEHDYYEGTHGYYDDDYNWVSDERYETVMSEWSFDGIKPVRKGG